MEASGPEAEAGAGGARHHRPEAAGSPEEAARGQPKPRLAGAGAGRAGTPTRAQGHHPTPSSSTGHPHPSQGHPRHHLWAEAETVSGAAALSTPVSQLTRLTPTAPSSTQATTLRE